jgi:pimeloyl-ACP methyl ester carboxylesterase
MEKVAEGYALGPSRVQLQNKDPRGFAEYARQLAEHSVQGSANTMAGYQGRRPSLYDFVEELKRIDVPTLLMLGDEEEPALEANLFLKRCIATAGLAVLPYSGHAINLEEPALFNRLLEDFLHQVELGRPLRRDARSLVTSIYGPGGKP